MSNIVEAVEHNALILGVNGQEFVQRVPEGTPKSRTRTYAQNGKIVTVHELTYKAIRGHITKMGVKTVNNGSEQLMVTIVNGDDVVILFISPKTKYFTSFARKIPNVNLSKEVTISCFDYISEQGPRTGIRFVQDGETITDYYWNNSMECSEGLPEMSKPYNKMSESERAEYYRTLNQYYKESIDVVAQDIPKSVVSDAASKNIESSEPYNSAGDAFLAKTKEDINKPSLKRINKK